METLAVKYRPKTFDDVKGQLSTVEILNRQATSGNLKNAYLFEGVSGSGKTTCARIFANVLNKGKGVPIEIDGASNNGVDNVRNIVEEASERALDCEYKVIIIDEAHMITTAGWNAFLKCIEEPPHYTIFIFCTTDFRRIPPTILNRLQHFHFARVPFNDIYERLIFICQNENINYEKSALEYIGKLAQGSMRQAITLLEKCFDYSKNITLNACLKSIGNYSYDIFFDLTNALIDKDDKKVLSITDDLYNEGQDLYNFIEEYLLFILDLSKYCIFKDLALTQIPSSEIENVNYVTDNGQQPKYFVYLQDKILEIRNTIKYDSYIKPTLDIMLLNIMR